MSKLAMDIKKEYGSQNISLASKMLWLLFKSPVVIYDSYVLKSLKSEGFEIKAGDYESYIDAWKESFDKEAPNLQKSCAGLMKKSNPILKKGLVPIKELRETIDSGWFQERVFDIYHWKNSSQQLSKSHN